MRSWLRLMNASSMLGATQVQFEQYGMWLLLLGGLLALPAAGASVLRARWRRAPGVPYETMVPRGDPDYDADVE